MQPTAIDSKTKNHPGERVAFIQACWHKEIVDQSRKGFVAEMISQGYQESDIEFFEVGGAFEIPLHAKLLAKSGRYTGIVAGRGAGHCIQHAGGWLGDGVAAKIDNTHESGLGCWWENSLSKSNYCGHGEE